MKGYKEYVKHTINSQVNFTPVGVHMYNILEKWFPGASFSFFFVHAKALAYGK